MFWVHEQVFSAGYDTEPIHQMQTPFLEELCLINNSNLISKVR